MEGHSHANRLGLESKLPHDDRVNVTYDDRVKTRARVKATYDNRAKVRARVGGKVTPQQELAPWSCMAPDLNATPNPNPSRALLSGTNWVMSNP